MKGFIQLPLMAWGAIAAGVMLLGMGVAVKVQTSRLDTCKAESAAFRTEVTALGEAAAAKAKAEIDRQAKLLHDAEAKYAKTKSDLAATNRRLRNERASRNAVPAAPDASSRPDLACFSRSELERTLRRLDEGVSGLVDEGSEIALRLQESRDWAGAALIPAQ